VESIYLATFFVALISSIFSGLAGGGGGFIMAPYWLISGMTPAQGATTGSFMAIGMGVSSLAAFRKTGHLPKEKRLTVLLSAVTVISSVFGALILPHIDVAAFTNTLALTTIAALPLLFIKRTTTHRFAKHRNVGIGLITLLLILSSIITSSAFSIPIAIILISFFDLSVLQMTALRRLITLSQSIVLFVVLTAQGFFIWQHALAGIIGGSLGSYIGTRFAISKGELFAKWALAGGALVGAIALLIN
jgi:uncharacterized membrane protein YfcA